VCESRCPCGQKNGVLTLLLKAFRSHRDPYQSRARRHAHGEKITGLPPCFEGAVRHAAAVVNHAEKLVQAILLGRDGDKDGDPPP
jgi:hypothetical protein